MAKAKKKSSKKKPAKRKASKKKASRKKSSKAKKGAKKKAPKKKAPKKKVYSEVYISPKGMAWARLSDEVWMHAPEDASASPFRYVVAKEDGKWRGMVFDSTDGNIVGVLQGEDATSGAAMAALEKAVPSFRDAPQVMAIDDAGTVMVAANPRRSELKRKLMR